MAVKSWSVGDVLSAADMNAWTVPQVAYKTSDTSHASTTTLTPDPALSVTVAANATYTFGTTLWYEGGTQGSSDFKWQFTGPSGASLLYSAYNLTTSGTASTASYNQSGLATVGQAGTNGAGAIRVVYGFGSFTTSSTAGSLALTWAQNTSSGTATILHTGSWISLQRIG